MIFDYLSRYPQNFSWWARITKVTLEEIQDSETDNNIIYILKFLKQFKNLKELVLKCNQSVLKSIESLESATVVIPAEKE